jgi:hypothetical protein
MLRKADRVNQVQEYYSRKECSEQLFKSNVGDNASAVVGRTLPGQGFYHRSGREFVEVADGERVPIVRALAGNGYDVMNGSPLAPRHSNGEAATNGKSIDSPLHGLVRAAILNRPGRCDVLVR